MISTAVRFFMTSGSVSEKNRHLGIKIWILKTYCGKDLYICKASAIKYEFPAREIGKLLSGKHTSIFWENHWFSFCWFICCNSSDVECVIDSSSQTSDVILCVIGCYMVICFIISPVNFKEISISGWFIPSQKHRRCCKFSHVKIPDQIRFCVGERRANY